MFVRYGFLFVEPTITGSPTLLTIFFTMSATEISSKPGYSFGYSNELCVIEEDTEYHNRGVVSRPRYISNDREEAIGIFKSRLSGHGMVVKKMNCRGNMFSRRRLSFMGKHLYISSLICTKVIDIRHIKSCSSSGRILSIDTKEYGSIVLKTPVSREAFAIRVVLTSKGSTG